MKFPAWLRGVVPTRSKVLLRSWHRRYLLDRGMRRARGVPLMGELPGRVVMDLKLGWGNDVIAAKPDFIRAIVRQMWQTRGHVLECGSGLSTLIAGMIAQRTGSRLWSLEHQPEWVEATNAALQRFGIDSAAVCHVPVRNFGEYNWYDISCVELPSRFELVICDGPPGDTHGGRYGLLPECAALLGPGCTVLLDDAQRPGEKAVLERWALEFSTRYVLEGSEEMVACITVPGSGTQ